SQSLRQAPIFQRRRGCASASFGLPHRSSATHERNQKDLTSLHNGLNPPHVTISERTAEISHAIVPPPFIESTTPSSLPFVVPSPSVELFDSGEASTPPGTPPVNFQALIAPSSFYQTPPIS